ncbi:MAG: ribokinase [Rubinisphaera brasiliensis]|uniref:ribokinase n=1 Tax=Rubinisphaera brasiliensis TaxID=119 RepID=UPI00391D043A
MQELDGRPARIVVLGSINMDLVASAERLPTPGETILAESFAEIPGGKGANQAVGASRAGGNVAMIGRVGQDSFGGRLLDNLQMEQVAVEAVDSVDGASSGVALITVSNAGENQIVVVPGSNGLLTPGYVDRFHRLIADADCLLIQLEIPLAAVLRGIEIAREAGVRVILDPAPALVGDVPPALFAVDLITPNETEAELLTGRDISTEVGLQNAALSLHSRGAAAVAITRGKQGVLLFDGEHFETIEPHKVTAVDSTAAGDAFAGAVAVKWAETGNLSQAVRWGAVAGGLSASRQGAQPSMARRSEIERASGQ